MPCNMISLEWVNAGLEMINGLNYFKGKDFDTLGNVRKGCKEVRLNVQRKFLKEGFTIREVGSLV